ncbi:DUF3592 domain-containing protein [Streptomyces sp. SAS_270]|uniref:DUF3592 domain-containing protein n=1 Tax=Streptomyces sp. SAS_270 TaxID=3412748 RepID=UPI00403CD848
MDRVWLFSLIPLAIGTVFLGFGVHGLRRAGALRRTGVTAKAWILRHEARRDDEGSTFHHPVVAWTDRDGRRCEYSSRFGRAVVTSGFGVGAQVTVTYDPQAPHVFAVEGWDMKAVDLLFTVLGSVLTAGTVTVLLVRLLTL